MDTFKVWLRPGGAACVIRVEGLENARWLFNRLTDLGLSCTSPAKSSGGHCVFRVAYTTAVAKAELERMLRHWPEVELISDPA